MEVGRPRRVAALELGSEHVGHQPVVPESLVAPVEADEEEPLARDLRQRRGRARALQDVVAERARQRVEDRGLEQQLPVVGRQATEDLVAQVVGDHVVVATERRELGRVSDGEGAERDSGRPALRPRPQLGALRGVQVEPGEPQELGGLVEVQGQLGRAELHDAVLGPEPGDGQRRGGTRRDGDGDPGRAVRDERGERGLRRGCPQHVQVVDDEDGAVGLDALQRHRQRDLEARGIVVLGVEGHPDEGARVLGVPVAQERRLAVAGGRDDRDQLRARQRRPGARSGAGAARAAGVRRSVPTRS